VKQRWCSRCFDGGDLDLEEHVLVLVDWRRLELLIGCPDEPQAYSWFWLRPREPGWAETPIFPVSPEPAWGKPFAPCEPGSKADEANQSWKDCILGA
jgi:hypothetical protein